MSRSDLERLSREELIELVLRLQRPEKTSRTSSKPPSTDRKEQRERSKPGGAKPGHEGHSRVMGETPVEVVEHRPGQCSCCGAALSADLPAETVSVHERIDVPEVRPIVTHHRRLAVGCPTCGTRVVAAAPEAARGTPFGPRLHALATYLKTFQALSYERLQGALSDLFGLHLSQGGLMNLLRRAQGRFEGGPRSALSALRQAEMVASGGTGGEDERRLAVLGRRQGGLEPVEDRTRQAVAAGRRRGVERTPAGSQAQARQHEDVLVVDDGHRFPFQAQGPAQGNGATHRHSSAAAENSRFPLDEMAGFRESH